MKMYHKISKTLLCCGQLIRMKWRKSKSLFLMDVMIGLFRESKLILNMVFPAVIIQLIMDSTKKDLVLLWILGSSLAMTIISIGIEILQRSLSNHSLRALNYLILKLNKKAMRINLSDFECGDNMEQFDKAYDGLWNSSDVDFVILSVIFSKLISFGVTAYIFSSVHWGVAIFVVATLLIEFILDIYLSERLHQKDQQQSELTHKRKYLSDTLFDYKTNKEVVLNGAVDFFINKFRTVFTMEMEMEKGKKADIFKNDRICACIEFFRICIVYVIAVLRYMGGYLPLANFTLFSSAVKQMTYAILQILQGFSSLLRASEYFDDYIQYMNLDETDCQSGSQHIDHPIFHIEFKNVSYQYPNQSDYAVQNLSFVISEGETVALVGDNGAGKSTVIRLLMRLCHVTDGDILLNGKSIYTYDYEEYISCFAPVFQDFMLYSFTLRENIWFDKMPTDFESETLLTDIGLSQKIHSLPKGLDTPYTKRFYTDGVEFSGGEEQKLAIARAYAKCSPVMFLDEPTSALDPLTECAFYELIHSLRGGKITLFISHRLSTTRFSDKILVLNQGRLVEEGTHEKLMRQQGFYYRIFKMQTQYYQ